MDGVLILRAARVVTIVVLAAAIPAGCSLEGPGDGPRIPVPVIRDAGIPWQAAPIRLPDDQLGAAIRACQANQSLPVGAQVVLVDARGGSRAIILYTTPGPTTGDCVVDRDLGGFQPRSSSATTALPVPSIGPDEILSGGVGTGSGDAPMADYSMVSGRIGANVAAVQVLVAGRPILASTGNGWFSAWWPGSDPVTAMIAIGADGVPLPSPS